MASNTEKQLMIRVAADIRRAQAELQRISGDIDRMGGASDKAGRDMDRMASAQGRATHSTNLLGTAASMAVKALAGFSAIKIIKDSTLLAANVETLGVVLEVVGRNAGYTKGEMELYTEQVKAMGITSQVSAQTVIRMTQAQMDLAQASRLARVAQDAAVVGQINSSEALDRLLHGIVSLEPKILRNIGIVVSFDQEYSNFARTADRAVDSLSATEKQQIAFNAVLREGEKLAGTYEAAMETANKQLGSLSREIETAGEEFGKLFQPAFIPLIKGTSTTVNALTEELRGLNAALGTSGIEDYTLERVESEIQRVEAALNKLYAKDLNFIEFFFFNGSQFVNLDRQLNALIDRQRQLQQEALKTGTILGREGAGGPPPEPEETPQQKAAREKAEKLLADLQRKTRLVGQDSATAQVNEALRFGDLAGLAEDSPLAAQLLEQARAYDARREAQERALDSQRELERAEEEALRNAERNLALQQRLRDDLRIQALPEREQAQESAVRQLAPGATEEQARTVRDLAAALYDLEEAKRRNAEIDLNREGDQERIAAMKEQIRLAGLSNREQAQAIAIASLSKDATEEQIEAMRKLAGEYHDLQNATSEFAIQAARNIQTAFGDELFNAMQNGFDNMGDAFYRMLQRMIADAAAAELAMALLGDFGKTGSVGGLAGSAMSFFADLFHSGGLASQPSQSRAVSPLVFAGAQRLHRGGIPGLRANEVPAILEDDEEVLTRDDPRHVANGGGSEGLVVNIYPKYEVMDGRDLLSKMGEHSQQFANMVTNAIGTYNLGGK